ncbi:MAG: phosphodiester glycosidase family protein [Oscillospiraceae bacterium]|nr:phosphodiester glycosidase family protein [Oscillospiraceae bacterium]
MKILKGILTAIVSLAALAVTGMLLFAMVFRVGNPVGTTQIQTGGIALADKFDMYMTNEISEALDGVLSMRKVYWLSDDDLVAPEPDQSKFGSTSDPTTLGWLLEEAADLLEGQETYFSTETQIVPGTEVLYYLDDTILTITWKEAHDRCVYTFSEVKIADPSQFRRFLAGGEYGSEKQFITTEMAASVNAVVASSGDFYNFRKVGVVVYDGIARRVNSKYTDTCYIDANGDLHFTYAGEIADLEEAQQYVDENGIRFSLAFGPVLVDNGQRVEPNRYHLGEINENYARAGLGQLGELHYLLAAANTGGDAYPHVHDIHEFAHNLQQAGCVKAYALDGGQTAVIAMNDKLINKVVYGYQRKISDIIYFATAVPETP